MCAVIGALLYGLNEPMRFKRAHAMLQDIWNLSHERGRDGRGWHCITDQTSAGYVSTLRVEMEDVERNSTSFPIDFFPVAHRQCNYISFIANLRAEPTTEHVVNKAGYDQQPYRLRNWAIVHNGTIANDRELRTNEYESRIDSAAIVEQLAQTPFTEGAVGALRNSFRHFNNAIMNLKGSFAILATTEEEPDHMMVACNYRPVWYVHTEFGIFFASARGYLPRGYNATMLEPYSATSFLMMPDGEVQITAMPLQQPRDTVRAVVVCSGGLDSVVAATAAQRGSGYEIELVHFRYGSRAEGPEVDAVLRVGKELGVPVHIIPLPIYKPGDSPLLDPNSTVAGGEAGAEFAHEWVPARNLVMLAMTTAWAESNRFDVIILGNNLEEAGAYPDNEPEFISRFNDILPFAVADGKRIRVEMPVGNLMKHEIVKLGLEIGAPLHLTWSCYRAGALHCGTCGPCYMRRQAFNMNNALEVIQYASLDKEV